VYFVDFNPVRGSEQGGRRPALIVSNNVGNRYGSVVTVVAITSTIPKRAYPQNVSLPAGPLPNQGTVLCGQILTVSKQRLQKYVGPVSQEVLRNVEDALRAHLDL
jgi:mRNA interferase MazF